MKLSQLIRAVQADLPITLRHEQWLANNSDPTYSEQAIEFAQQVLAGIYTKRKRMLFRSSGVGMCQRRRVFAAIGIREQGITNPAVANIFHTGNYLHLKWQMAGLTEGWLDKAEVIVDNPASRFGGTLDGLLHDGSGFEFKSINDRGFADVWNQPKAIHIRQVHAYMYLNKDIEKFSIVYENKNNGEWRELRVDKDPQLIKAIDREVGALNQAVDTRKLPEPLPDCIAGTGAVFRQCPFNSICLKVKKWPQVINGQVIGQ